MKRKSLFNRIISLSIIAALYLSMSASAYAELDIETPEEPAITEEAPAPSKAAPAAETTEEPAVVSEDSGEPVANLTAGAVDAATPEVAGDNPEAALGEGTEGQKDEAAAGETTGEEPKPENPKAEEAKVDEAVKDATAETDSKDKPAEEKVEPKEGDTYFIITTNEDGTAVKATYEYVVNEETGELEAILKEEVEGRFDEDGNPILEEEKKECEHELVYEPLKNGKHKVKCKNCDLEEYEETCEYDENGICKKCGWHRLPDPQLIYEDDEVIVTVKGAIPENADLKVTPIKSDVDETKEQFKEVADKLLENTKLDDFGTVGFVAYDICFVSIETEEEIEPDGDVTVSMEYKKHIIPIETDENTKSIDVEVIHFNEEENVVENLTEEKKASLELDSEQALKKAEFTSDSFSTYVFIYTANNDEEITIIFNNITRDGENISGLSTTPKTHTVTSVNQIDEVSSFADSIEGYRFVEASKIINGQSVVFNKFKYETETTYGLFSSKTTPYIKLYMDDTAITDRIEITSEDNIVVDMLYEKDIALSISKRATGDPAADDQTEYEFQLLDSNNSPVAYKNYKNGETSLRTDANGIFKLKSGESADFTTFNPGQYTITETQVLGGAYFFPDEEHSGDFKTKFFVNGTIVNEYSPEFSGTRTSTFTVVAGKLTDVSVKNYYYTKIIKSDKDQILSKYIRYNETKDDYELTLKYVAPEKVVEETSYEKESDTYITTKHVNVVMVIDRSASMADNNRADHMQQAAKIMAETFQIKRNVEAKWKIVDFGTSATLASVTQSWVNTDDFYDIVKKSTNSRSVGDSVTDPYTYSGGWFSNGYGFNWYYSGYGYSGRGATNYESALKLAKAQLATAPPNEEKIIIFLTDGVPTKYDGQQNGGNAFNATAYKKALAVAEGIKCSGFFAVGVDFGTNETYTVDYKSYYAKDLLAGIKDAVDASIKELSTVDSADLPSIFKSIAGKISSQSYGSEEPVITTERATNAVITDPLSDYVEIEPGTEFYVSVEVGNVDIWNKEGVTYVNGTIGADGKQINGATFSSTAYNIPEITADYDADSRTMIMRFTSTYQLDPSYSYKLVFKVIPSEEAYAKYVDRKEGYDAVGDPNTDFKPADESTPVVITSEGQDGYKSNGDAKVTYTFQGDTKTPRFPHPVIQVHPKYEWEIYKTDADGKDGQRLGGAEFLLKDDDTNSTVAFLGDSKAESQGLVDWRLDGTDTIPVGKTYILTEEVAPPGYAVSGEYWKIQLSEENEATVTAYEPSEGEPKVISCQMETKRDGKNVTYKFYYKNFVTGYTLPETGGNGIYRTTALGLIFMLSSVFLFYRNKRKSKSYC